MSLKQILSENIVIRRKKLGISQVSLAERLHISPAAMARIEKGVHSPRIERLESIARHLQCGVSELFRPYSDTPDNRASAIEEALAPLPPCAQDAIVNLVIQASKAISQKN